MSRFAALVWHLLAALVGAAVGVAAVAVHRTEMVGLPVGLLVAVATSLVVAWSFRLQYGRLAASYCLGWIVPVGLAVAGRPEGDYAVASDLRGYLLMGSAFAMVVIGVTSLANRDSSSEAGPLSMARCE